MNSKYFWRNVVYALAAINLLFWLWSDGNLRFLGLGPKPVQEPQRLENQVNPEMLTLKPASSSSAAAASTSAASVASQAN